MKLRIFLTRTEKLMLATIGFLCLVIGLMFLLLYVTGIFSRFVVQDSDNKTGQMQAIKSQISDGHAELMAQVQHLQDSLRRKDQTLSMTKAKAELVEQLYRAGEQNRQLDRVQNKRNREMDREAFNYRYTMMREMFDSLSSRHESMVQWLQEREHEGRYLDTNQYGVFVTFIKGDSVHTTPLAIYNDQTVTDVRQEASIKRGLLPKTTSSRIKGMVNNSNPLLRDAPFSVPYEYKKKLVDSPRKVKHEAKRPKQRLKYL